MSIFFKTLYNSLLVAIVAFPWSATFAFQDSLTTTPYYSESKDKIYIKPQFTVRHTGFYLRDAGRKGDIQYFSLPNYLSTGLSLYMFDLKLSVNYQLDRKPGTKGRFDIQTLWTSKRFGVDFSFVRQGLTSSDFRELPMNTRSIWTSGYYIFNYRRFHMSPGINQTVIQNRSAGSFLISSLISAYKVESDQILIDTENRAYYGELGQMQSVNSITWGLMGGYAYTLVYKKYFITAMALMGPGHYWQNYNAIQNDGRDIQFGFLTSLRGMAGYQGDRWFYGGIFQSMVERVNNDVMIYHWNQFSVRVYLGLRLTEKGVFTKSVNDLFSKKHSNP